MLYYIKEGQSSVFTRIKILENQCQIPALNLNIKRNEKIVKKIKKRNINKVILSKNLKEHKQFIECLNNYDVTIFDGKWIMQYLLENIIEYLEKKEKIANIDEITILANDLTNEVKKNIIKFSNKYKKIRIITNHLEKFKKLEEELYNKNGISIIITNNKRKALAKSLLIVNFDFVEENINQYNISENAIIINLNEKIRINKKRYCGLIITDYKVEFGNINDEEVLDMEDVFEKQKDFCLKEIIEAKVYSITQRNADFNRFEIVEDYIKKYNLKIKEIYGMNGKLA